MATLPHFRLPFRVSALGADVLEQDSSEEILQCVEVLLGTEQGSRQELPDYGIPDQVFVPETAVQTAVIEAQCAKWEPRALATIESEPDRFDEVLRNIRAKVRIDG